VPPGKHRHPQATPLKACNQAFLLGSPSHSD
jgi:hypothetical protein